MEAWISSLVSTSLWLNSSFNSSSFKSLLLRLYGSVSSFLRRTKSFHTTAMISLSLFVIPFISTSEWNCLAFEWCYLCWCEITTCFSIRQNHKAHLVISYQLRQPADEKYNANSIYQKNTSICKKIGKRGDRATLIQWVIASRRSNAKFSLHPNVSRHWFPTTTKFRCYGICDSSIFFSEWNISKGLAIITGSHIPTLEVGMSRMAGPAFPEAQTLANLKVIITLSFSDNDLEREIWTYELWRHHQLNSLPGCFLRHLLRRFPWLLSRLQP